MGWGFLGRDEHVARGLSLTDEAVALLCKLSDTIRAATNFVQIPISGDIAAGEPVDLGNDTFVTYDEDEMVVVDAGQLPRPRNSLYALRVRGHSMIDALVDDGDIVILQKASQVCHFPDRDVYPIGIGKGKAIGEADVRRPEAVFRLPFPYSNFNRYMAATKKTRAKPKRINAWGTTLTKLNPSTMSRLKPSAAWACGVSRPTMPSGPSAS